jgi:FMN-dependent NADH-azoreductase
MKALDYQETYLRTILGFIGITDIETIAIEGVGLGGEVRFKALEAGKSRAASIGAKAA